MGWQAGKREALVKALTTASLTASHNLKPLLKTPTIESVAIVQFMVLRFPRLLTRCHTLAKNCQLLEYAGVATARKVVQRHISLRFVWFQFKYASLPLCADDLKLCADDLKLRFHMFHKWIQFSPSLIIFVWRVTPGNYWEMQEQVQFWLWLGNHMRAQRIMFNLSIDMGRSTSCFIVNPNIGEKPNKCN